VSSSSDLRKILGLSWLRSRAWQRCTQRPGTDLCRGQQWKTGERSPHFIIPPTPAIPGRDNEK
jgi:hypothetical protein